MTHRAVLPLRLSLSEEELEEWGMRIGREVELPVVLALRGELGTGKSTLARAVARGAGVAGSVPSPTFNLLFVYDTPRGRVQHLDLYRLEANDVWELGWDELGSGRDLVMIEWAERAEALLPRSRWDVVLADDPRPNRRSVEARPAGTPPPLPPPPAPPRR